MSATTSTKTSNETSKGTQLLWDQAIDAETQIARAHERVRRLRRSIAVFRKLRDSGEPWPGTVESLDDQSDSAPSGD